MQSRVLKKVQFMPQSKYASVVKSDENLYLVEFQPDLSIFPNYNVGVNVTAGTEYTVGKGVLANYSAGWFKTGFTSRSWHGRDPQLVIWINNQPFYNSYFCCFTIIYLSTGNTFKCNTTYRNPAMFYPVKTV